MATTRTYERDRVNLSIAGVAPVSSAPDLLITNNGDVEIWEVPFSAKSRYLSHNYFRYIGKFPPQLAREFIHRYGRKGQRILDPMCGGGTVLIEARCAGYDAIGYDVNPVAILISQVATTSINPERLDKELNRLIDDATETLSGQRVLKFTKDFDATFRDKVAAPDLHGHEHYFDERSLYTLSWLKMRIEHIRDQDIQRFCLLGLLSILRHVSRANVKKMNTEIDESKKPKPVLPAFVTKLRRMQAINSEIYKWPETTTEITLNDARTLPLQPEEVGLIVVHPPYLTNTAFSEVVELPLAWLGIKHTNVWKKELRARGSFLNEPDGLRKYLVGWHRVLSEIHRVLQKNGVCAAVIGDGQMDYVRIPVATITQEFAADIGFTIEKVIQHRINNNTGMTLTHRMRQQHILILRK